MTVLEQRVAIMERHGLRLSYRELFEFDNKKCKSLKFSPAVMVQVIKEVRARVKSAQGKRCLICAQVGRRYGIKFATVYSWCFGRKSINLI